MIQKLLQTRPRIESALSALDKSRLKLPEISLQRLFPEFVDSPIQFYEVPVGAWSAPIADVAMLLKVIVCAKPKRLLEVGSFRGYTALMMARHMDSDARLVTIDRNAEHGEAYRLLPLREKIDRRVGLLGTETLRQDAPGSYDLIFLDAGHHYNEVKHDTELLLPLLSGSGYFIWHDYANWGRFSSKNGVPEYLHELAAKSPIAQVSGSGLGIYNPSWATKSKDLYRAALINARSAQGETDPWNTEAARG
jgi:hypothetical protein